MTLSVTALILVSALASALGNYLLVLANKAAEASLIAPLVYTQLISATGLGVLEIERLVALRPRQKHVGLVLIAIDPGFPSPRT